MSEEANWQTKNAQYLSTALAWLRAKLELCATRGEEVPVISASELRPVPAEPPGSESRSLWRRLRGEQQLAGSQSSGLLPTSKGSGPQPNPLAQLASNLAEAESQSPAPPALITLARRLGLSPFEREVLLLCATMELDTGIASLCARAQCDSARPYPTFALALTLFEAPAWDALSPERPLRYWRLIEISQPGGLPLTTSPLRADERIVSYLNGAELPG